MPKLRFTAYLSVREREAIRETAHRLNASENYVVRSAIRTYLRLDKVSQLSHLSQVPDDNGGGDE